MTRTLQSALKAGLTAYAACLLAVALFASPVISTHADFGHSHPKPVAAHMHALTGVFSSVLTPRLTSLVPGFIFFALYEAPQKTLSLLAPRFPWQSRAPPIF